MKVLVIGGTGMFGSRLCDLLLRDGMDVTVAGRRSNGSKKTCTNHANMALNFAQIRRKPPNLQYIALNREGPLAALAGFDVIVDAAGPFHAYGGDPYRVARAAIAAGAHYFDLCDNADFCQGISILDGKAKAAGVTVASGMSSVPAVSSAAVDALCDGHTPLMIETAILPGNKAERGRSVVESILSQTGKFYYEKQAGRDVNVRSWSAPRSYDLGQYSRQGWRIEVPDQRLFPDHFNCLNVTFRAGLELSVMRYGLGVLSFARSKLDFGMPRWFVSAMLFGARMLAPFGTDRGGMLIQVTLAQGAGFIRKTWIMRAENGDGPYTPAIAIRAACRDLVVLKRGAKPALSLIPLGKIEDFFLTSTLKLT
jgi:NAD(P)-dependent dehydrogenase (short-subunit alcohol dehydrogenase family)